MPELTQYMIVSGIPKELIGLILMLPIVATLIAFSREIIGVKGFGIYTSLIIAYAFVGTGLVNGAIIFTLVLISGTFMRLFIRRFRLLYLPRMAIVLTGVAFTLFFMFIVAGIWRQTDFLKISLFPIIIMIPLVEKFIGAQIERGPQTAITLTVETLVLASLSFFIITWETLTGFLLDWPLAIFPVVLLINVLLGKWTGLRLTEMVRFRELIKYVESSHKQ